MDTGSANKGGQPSWTLDYLEYGFPLLGTMLKVNPKLGGCNCKVNTVMLKKPTLLLGADISRPKAGLLDTEAVSIASLASNGNAEGSTYIGQARLQEPRQEIIQALIPMAGNAIRHYLCTTKLDAAKLRELKAPLKSGRPDRGSLDKRLFNLSFRVQGYDNTLRPRRAGHC